MGNSHFGGYYGDPDPSTNSRRRHRSSSRHRHYSGNSPFDPLPQGCQDLIDKYAGPPPEPRVRCTSSEPSLLSIMNHRGAAGGKGIHYNPCYDSVFPSNNFDILGRCGQKNGNVMTNPSNPYTGTGGGVNPSMSSTANNNTDHGQPATADAPFGGSASGGLGGTSSQGRLGGSTPPQAPQGAGRRPETEAAQQQQQSNQPKPPVAVVRPTAATLPVRASAATEEEDGGGKSFNKFAVGPNPQDQVHLQAMVTPVASSRDLGGGIDYTKPQPEPVKVSVVGTVASAPLDAPLASPVPPGRTQEAEAKQQQQQSGQPKPPIAVVRSTVAPAPGPKDFGGGADLKKPGAQSQEQNGTGGAVPTPSGSALPRGSAPASVAGVAPVRPTSTTTPTPSQSQSPGVPFPYTATSKPPEPEAPNPAQRPAELVQYQPQSGHSSQAQASTIPDADQSKIGGVPSLVVGPMHPSASQRETTGPNVVRRRSGPQLSLHESSVSTASPLMVPAPAPLPADASFGRPGGGFSQVPPGRIQETEARQEQQQSNQPQSQPPVAVVRPTAATPPVTASTEEDDEGGKGPEKPYNKFPMEANPQDQVHLQAMVTPVANSRDLAGGIDYTKPQPELAKASVAGTAAPAPEEFGADLKKPKPETQSQEQNGIPTTGPQHQKQGPTKSEVTLPRGSPPAPTAAVTPVRPTSTAKPMPGEPFPYTDTSKPPEHEAPNPASRPAELVQRQQSGYSLKPKASIVPRAGQSKTGGIPSLAVRPMPDQARRGSKTSQGSRKPKKPSSTWIPKGTAGSEVVRLRSGPRVSLRESSVSIASPLMAPAPPSVTTSTTHTAGEGNANAGPNSGPPSSSITPYGKASPSGIIAKNGKLVPVPAGSVHTPSGVPLVRRPSEKLYTFDSHGNLIRNNKVIVPGWKLPKEKRIIGPSRSRTSGGSGAGPSTSKAGPGTPRKSSTGSAKGPPRKAKSTATIGGSRHDLPAHSRPTSGLRPMKPNRSSSNPNVPGGARVEDTGKHASNPAKKSSTPSTSTSLRRKPSLLKFPLRQDKSTASGRQPSIPPMPANFRNLASVFSNRPNAAAGRLPVRKPSILKKNSTFAPGNVPLPLGRKRSISFDLDNTRRAPTPSTSTRRRGSQSQADVSGSCPRKGKKKPKWLNTLGPADERIAGRTSADLQQYRHLGESVAPTPFARFCEYEQQPAVFSGAGLQESRVLLPPDVAATLGTCPDAFCILKSQLDAYLEAYSAALRATHDQEEQEPRRACAIAPQRRCSGPDLSLDDWNFNTSGGSSGGTCTRLPTCLVQQSAPPCSTGRQIRRSFSDICTSSSSTRWASDRASTQPSQWPQCPLRPPQPYQQCPLVPTPAPSQQCPLPCNERVSPSAQQQCPTGGGSQYKIYKIDALSTDTSTVASPDAAGVTEATSAPGPEDENLMDSSMAKCKAEMTLDLLLGNISQEPQPASECPPTGESESRSQIEKIQTDVSLQNTTRAEDALATFDFNTWLQQGVLDFFANIMSLTSMLPPPPPPPCPQLSPTPDNEESTPATAAAAAGDTDSDHSDSEYLEPKRRHLRNVRAHKQAKRQKRREQKERERAAATATASMTEAEIEAQQRTPRRRSLLSQEFKANLERELYAGLSPEEAASLQTAIASDIQVKFNEEPPAGLVSALKKTSSISAGSRVRFSEQLHETRRYYLDVDSLNPGYDEDAEDTPAPARPPYCGTPAPEFPSLTVTVSSSDTNLATQQQSGGYRSEYYRAMFGNRTPLTPTSRPTIYARAPPRSLDTYEDPVMTPFGLGALLRQRFSDHALETPPLSAASSSSSLQDFSSSTP